MGIHSVLEDVMAAAVSEKAKGEALERLIKVYLSQDHLAAMGGIVRAIEAAAQLGVALPAADTRQNAMMQKLLNEHEMGELFKVIGFVKGPWFDAIGFAHGDRTHTL